MKRLLLGLAALSASAQAPLLQDGSAALRQARLDWVAGLEPLGPSTMPFLELGWGGADGSGPTPLIGGEGLGATGRGWGLGLQGRVSGRGWTAEAAWLALGGHGRTLGLLHRAGLAYQGEAGWRLALEQAPLAWGPGLLGGDLLGSQARAFPRLHLATPEAAFGALRLRGEAFAGRLTGARTIPEWMPDRRDREALRAAGRDLARPDLAGLRIRAAFGPQAELSAGALRLSGGEDSAGHPAESEADRLRAVVELRLRLPALARAFGARGTALTLGRSSQPDGTALTLGSGRILAGLQAVWDGWDLALEYAGPSSRPTLVTDRPSHLADFSARGEALGSAFGPAVATRTAEAGFALPAEGRAVLRLVRATAPADHPQGPGAWALQTDLQRRTATGRLGASLASVRVEPAAGPARWGWALAGFHAFRVF